MKKRKKKLSNIISPIELISKMRSGGSRATNIEPDKKKKYSRAEFKKEAQQKGGDE